MRQAGFYNQVNAAINNLNTNLNKTYDRRLKMQMHLNEMRLQTRQMQLNANDPRVRLKQMQAARQMERVPLNIKGIMPPNPGDHNQETKLKEFQPILHEILGRNDIQLTQDGQILNTETKQPFQPRRFEANEDAALINIAAFNYFQDPRNIKRKNLEDAERKLVDLEKRYGASEKGRGTSGKLQVKEAKAQIKKLKEEMATVQWQLESTDEAMNRTRDMINSNFAIYRNPRALGLFKWMYDKDNDRMIELIKKGGKTGAMYDSKWYTLKEFENADDPKQRRWVQVSKHPAAGGLGSFAEKGVLWRPVTPKGTGSSSATINRIDSFIRSNEDKKGRYFRYIDAMKRTEHGNDLPESVKAAMTKDDPELLSFIMDLPIDDQVKYLQGQIDFLEAQLQMPSYKGRVKAIREEAKKIQEKRAAAVVNASKKVDGTQRKKQGDVIEISQDQRLRVTQYLKAMKKPVTEKNIEFLIKNHWETLKKWRPE